MLGVGMSILGGVDGECPRLSRADVITPEKCCQVKSLVSAWRLLHGSAWDADEYRADSTGRLAAALHGRDRKVLVPGSSDDGPSQHGGLRRPASPFR